MAESSTLRYSIQKLNGENYSTWSYKMELMLMDEGIWDVIAEDKPAETETQKLAIWSKNNQKARVRIGLLVEDNQLLHIRNVKTAKEAWEALKEYHQKSTLSTKVLLLKRICRTVLCDGGNMETHIATFSENIERLTALGLDLPDELKAALLLGSLPESFDILVTALESRPDSDITFQFVKSKLLDEYKKRRGTQAMRDSSNGETAMKSVHHKNQSSDKTKLSCFFCKKTGHLKKDCYSYKSWKNKQNKANKASVLNVDESLFMAKEIINSAENTCFSAQVQKESAQHTWIIDSGATSHISSAKDFFRSFDPSVRGTIQLAAINKKSEVLGMGSGTIKCTVDGEAKVLHMENVLYVPSFGSSLISVKKLSLQGYAVNFQGLECRIIKNGSVHAKAKAGKYAPDLYEIHGIVEAAHAAINGKHGDNCVHMWHRRFGHRDISAIKSLAEKKLATGITIESCERDEFCEYCVKGKMARKPFPKEADHKSQAILDLLHTDVCGPMQTVTPGNKRYVMTIIDDFSRFTTVYFLKTKDEVGAKIKEFIQMAITQFSKTPKCVRSDRGREYVNAELIDYLKGKGIQIQYTAAYSPQQNGIAERKNRSLIEMAKCMLLDANLEKRYWAEAVNTANFLQNRLPTRATEKTPYELWHSRKPNVKNLHIFGCDVYMQIPKEQRRKLDDKAEKLTFIGYSDESKAYRLLNRKTGRVKVSRDVIFIENSKGEQTELNTEHEELTFSGGNAEDKVEEESSINIQESSSDSDNLDNNIQEGSTCSEVRRSARENRGVPPNRFMATSNLAQSSSEDPRNRQEALSRADKEQWQAAMDEEIQSLMANDTWDIVPAPKDRDIVTCKWVYKIKRDGESGAEKYKARLVARGFSQKFGTDYDEVFAPVVKQTTFKVLLTIAGQNNLIVKHFDAKSAFLNGNLKETIFMAQPEGYEKEDKDGNRLVCKLKKGLYGLKQAAKIWNEQLDSLLKSQNFIQSEADSCLYIKDCSQEKIYIIIHVDDFLIAAKKTEQINNIANFLNKNFQLTDLGIIKKYLGIEVRRNEKGIFCIKQTDYIKTILKRFGLEDAKVSYIPLDTGYYKNRENQPLMQNSEKYQQLIGALLYLSINTRPDISASVAILSQRNKEPTDTDWLELKRVCRYLKGTINHELTLGHQAKENALIGYADADWAENRADRKSTSGYLFMFTGAAISWGCRKQSCVALSSTEAEYIALAEACQEVLWIRRLIQDFTGKQQPTTKIYEDNQSCIKLLSIKKFNHRTKHIDTKFHFVKDLKNDGILDFEYCSTQEMLADMFTKPLCKIKLKQLSEGCGLKNVYSV